MIEKNIAFIGAGNMAHAIIQGLLAKGYPAAAIRATTRTEASAKEASQALGISVGCDNQAAVAWADVVVLAVKPQMLAAVAADISGVLGKQLIISVAAGIDTDTLSRWLGGNCALIRSMPNTPSQVGMGASGLFANAKASVQDRAFAEQVAAATGRFIWVNDESLMHAVTAVSGSGPAYYFYFMEAMIEAGIKLGLSREQAQLLTLQTARGAAELAQASDLTPAELKRRVMSPGGTTEQAIAHFEQSGFAATITAAMDACAQRSETLGRELGQQTP